MSGQLQAESRTTSSVGKMRGDCPHSWLLRYPTSMLAACPAISAIGWATVVSLGKTVVAVAVLSKPTTATSSGTDLPAALRPYKTPAAMASE